MTGHKECLQRAKRSGRPSPMTVVSSQYWCTRCLGKREQCPVTICLCSRGRRFRYAKVYNLCRHAFTIDTSTYMYVHTVMYCTWYSVHVHVCGLISVLLSFVLFCIFLFLFLVLYFN